MNGLLISTPETPAIDPDTRGATTIREQLTKHRADASCAACRRKMNPPDLALESYDIIGGWIRLGGARFLIYQANSPFSDSRRGMLHGFLSNSSSCAKYSNLKTDRVNCSRYGVVRRTQDPDRDAHVVKKPSFKPKSVGRAAGWLGNKCTSNRDLP